MRSTTSSHCSACDERPVVVDIKVLVVDDSAVIRRAVKTAIEAEPGVKVVATANDGVHALDVLRETKVDIVVSDLEMPHMDGAQLCQKIANLYPRLPVIVLSGAASQSRITVAALAGGAVDYVSKPSGANVANVMEELRQNLVPKIKTHALRRMRTNPSGVMPTGGSAAAAAGVTYTLRPRKTNRLSAIGIAVSTGGPQALSKLLADIPADIGVPILIVQHMPPTFTGLLADRLNGVCPLEVREAQGGEEVARGVWVAPGGKHMIAVRRGTKIVLETNEDPPEQSCRPAADVLLRSMANVWGQELLCVVLTGMGADGTNGAKVVVENGGSVIAQDAESSVVWGMPGSVTRAGLVETVLPLELVAQEITARVRTGRLR
jgi:two-component system chemotaxis response regulator CheB